MPSIDGTTGNLPSGRVAIIASRYNANICDSMVQAALQSLSDAGIPEDKQWLIRVPGAWE